MSSLKEVKSRINSVVSTQQLTKAMKMVAAAKLRKAQDRILQMRPYAEKLNDLLHNVASGTAAEENVFSEKREVTKVMLIVITSDRGLCGAFNSNVIKAAKSHIESNYKTQLERKDLTILPIGKKALDHFSKRGYEVNPEFAFLFHDLNFENARKTTEYVMKAFKNEDIDKVDLVYNEFKNVATQIQITESYLPIEEVDPDEESDFEIDYIFQPSRDYVIEEIIPKSLKIQFYKALLESNAAEQGARMTAMDQATDNAGELLEQLKLTYNRTRQAVITKEISEIVAGADAL